MNALQAIDSDRPILLTLNRADAIDPALRARPSSSTRHPVFDARRDARPSGAAHEIQGARGHLLRGRLLGLRVPRGRRAERARGRARRVAPDAPMTAGRVLYEGTARPSAGSTPDRATPQFSPRLLPRLSRRRRAARFARPLPRWSARRPRARAVPAPRLPRRTTGPLGDAVRDLVEARLGRRPTGPVHLLAQLRTFGWLFNPSPSTTAGAPTAARSTRSVLEVTNTPWGERHWYVLDAHATATTAQPAEGDARVAVPAHGRRLPGVVDRARATTLHLRHRRRARARRRCSRPASRCGGRSLDRRHASACSLRYPAHAAARVARDLPPGRGAVPRPRARIPSSVPTCAGDPAHDPATLESRARDRELRLLEHVQRRHARARRPDRARRTSANATAFGRRAPIDVPRRRSRPRACTSESCAKAASVWASRTPTAGGTPTTSPASCGSRSAACSTMQRPAATRCIGSRPPSSTRSHDCGEPTPTATRATSARTTTSATSFFQRMLDETMAYSCAIFDAPGMTLADASRAKFDRLARALDLVARRSAPRDRDRLGRLRAPRCRALRMPRDDHHDLAARNTSSRPNASGPPASSTGSPCSTATTATCEAPSTRRSRSR